MRDFFCSFLYILKWQPQIICGLLILVLKESCLFQKHSVFVRSFPLSFEKKKEKKRKKRKVNRDYRHTILKVHYPFYVHSSQCFDQHDVNNILAISCIEFEGIATLVSSHIDCPKIQVSCPYKKFIGELFSFFLSSTFLWVLDYVIQFSFHFLDLILLLSCLFVRFNVCKGREI